MEVHLDSATQVFDEQVDYASSLEVTLLLMRSII